MIIALQNEKEAITKKPCMKSTYERFSIPTLKKEELMSYIILQHAWKIDYNIVLVSFGVYNTNRASLLIM